MTFTINPIGDQPFAPGNYAYSYNPDQLIAGPLQLVTYNVEVPTGNGILARGTVMGRLTTFSVVVTPGTNTGNGTVGSITVPPGNEFGSYTLTALSPTSFSVVDPEGVSLANATVGTAYTSGEINFTITAGGTAFVAGDSFTLNNMSTTGNVIPSVKTASDGSQTPVCILADTIDTTSGAQKVGAYFMGEFNSRAITYDSSWTLFDLTASLQARGIFLKSSVSAADPT
jgi:hypothetical protein